MSTREFDREELLAHVSWVRSLALQVARDPHVADDIAQETFLVALGGAVEERRSPRSWLAAVVRNLGRTRRRGEHRRSRRESTVARSEAEPSTLELFERASVHHELVGGLLELDEPYRTTLLLRFFEDETPAEVGRRMGVATSTVASRTAEGLARLRKKLERGGRKPEVWLSSILSLPASPPPATRVPRPPLALTGALTGAMTVGLETKLLAAGALCAGAALLVRSSGRSIVPELESPAPVAVADSFAVDAFVSEMSVIQAREEQSVATRPARPSTPHPHYELAPEVTASGRVIDLGGAPVAGVDVCRGVFPVEGAHHNTAVEPTSNGRLLSACSPSDAAGRFEVVGRPPFTLAVRSARYATVYQGEVHPREPEREPTVVVGWRIPLAGLVVDEAGGPVAGAVAVIDTTEPGLEAPGLLLESSSRVSLRAVTDATGTFRFEEAAELPGAEVRVVAPGFAPARVPVPPGGDEHVRVVLARAGSTMEALVGRVIHSDGAPAPGAHVSFGRASTRTDDEGRFVLELLHGLHESDLENPLRLIAARPGSLPGFLELPSLARAEAEGWPREIVLVLGAAPLSIRGRVVDEKGEGVPFVGVETLESTRFGLVEETRQGWFMLRTVEEIAGGGEAFTNAAGEFELEGLLDQEYTLEATQRRSLLTVVSEPIPAGQRGVTLVLDSRGVGRIGGRVVDGAGQPVPDTRVSVTRERRSYLAVGTGTVTDGEGRFLLEGVTTAPRFLRLEGPRIVPDLFRELPGGVPLEELELVVGLRCELLVEWGEWNGTADELRLLDADGAELELVDVAGGGLTPLDGIPFERGLSRVYVVPDSAAFAAVLYEGEEVQRFRISPVPGELETLRL